MKKNTLISSVLVFVLLSGLFYLANRKVYASERQCDNKTTISGSVRNDLEYDIFSYGEFDEPINLDQYDNGLNQIGLDTGKIIFTYVAKASTDISFEKNKYFNLKLPSEFDYLYHSERNLKSVITAAYKIPQKAEFTTFLPEDISVDHEGTIDFHLNSNEPISADESIVVKVSINYGKILDDLNLGASYDYQTIIPNAEGSYEFRGMLTSNKHLLSFPEEAATGLTEGNSACAPVTDQSN